MKNSQKIQEVSNRKNRTEYTGTYQNFRSFGKAYSQKENQYNEYQNTLFNRAMFGVKSYTQEELKAMHPQRIERIEKVNQHAHRQLNIWKQEKVIAFTNEIFKLFTKSTIANDIVELYSKPDPRFYSKFSLRDFNVTKEEIVERLVSKGVLPRNFDTLQ